MSTVTDLPALKSKLKGEARHDTLYLIIAKSVEGKVRASIDDPSSHDDSELRRARPTS
jgi:hypothetical protein